MSGLVGRGQISYRKRNVAESNIPAIGIKAISFSHKPTANATDPTYLWSALIAADDLTDEGYVNEDPTRLNIGQFRNNLRVISNLNGELIDFDTYTVTDESITFRGGYTVDADNGEYFIFYFDRGAVTGNRIVDARPLRSSGTLLSGTFDFPVGQFFKIASDNMLSNGTGRQQIGNVQVFVNGILMARNVGNADEDTADAASQTGNYREINSIDINSTTANAIRFNNPNVFSGDASVVVISTNLIVDNPESTTVLDQLEGNNGLIATNTAAIATNTAALANVGGGAISAISVLFNTGTHTVPVPANFSDVVGVRIRACGGGASGGGGGTGNNAGTAQGGYGGGAGVFQERYISVGNGALDLSSSATSLTVVIGTGGAAVAGQPQQSSSTQGPNDGNAGNATTLTAPRGSDQVSTTLQTWAGGTINKYIGTATYQINNDPNSGTPPGLNQTNNGANGGDTAFGRGGGGGHGNNAGNDSVGGGGGGGAGWFDGSDGSSEAGQGSPGAASGAGGNGGMVIEWLTINITQIG